MYENGKIYMGLAGDKRVELALNMCNRHGLIAGASGTGKTVTMKVMAESFSDAGVPVFLCDVKGDVAGICAPGQSSEGMEKRIDKFGLRIDQQDIIKALLVEPGSERQVFPPVPFTADDIGGHDFVDCPQAFIISQRYHSSFLKWIKLG